MDASSNLLGKNDKCKESICRQANVQTAMMSTETEYMMPLYIVISVVCKLLEPISTCRLPNTRPSHDE